MIVSEGPSHGMKKGDSRWLITESNDPKKPLRMLVTLAKDPEVIRTSEGGLKTVVATINHRLVNVQDLYTDRFASPRPRYCSSKPDLSRLGIVDTHKTDFSQLEIVDS